MTRVIVFGTVVFLITLTIQSVAAVGLIRLIPWLVVRFGPIRRLLSAVLLLEMALLLLLAAALAQIGVWAVAFVLCGQFTDFNTAFYHSAVNFATLGYGDIIMSEPWHMLGPIEAVNGILMLGLSVSMLNTVVARVGTADT